ncbi:MAG TPA: hydrogenase maturation nickel metallochaperone HypA [Bryobacteraceae bacterium]|jgi:hydrogenase nickel incorporation protein HypA/HybF|nr:hydrogenase maturation nickel metallochaperone HypA [Bryobacteraceae bacterium]
MHELSIATSIVEIAAEEGARHAGRISVVYLKLGALAGVARDALLFSWELACRETPLEGARLEIEDTPGAELRVTAIEIGDWDGDAAAG